MPKNVIYILIPDDSGLFRMIPDDSGRFRPIPELKFLKPNSRICFSIAGFVADILGPFPGSNSGDFPMPKNVIYILIPDDSG